MTEFTTQSNYSHNEQPCVLRCGDGYTAVTGQLYSLRSEVKINGTNGTRRSSTAPKASRFVIQIFGTQCTRFHRIKALCKQSAKITNITPHKTWRKLLYAMLVPIFAISALASVATAFPSYGSLAGLSREELDQIIPTLNYQAPPNPPGPLKDTSAKLVNDAAHPWRPLGRDDIRGPCPGLNTLASHGVRSRFKHSYRILYSPCASVSSSIWNSHSISDYQCCPRR